MARLEDLKIKIQLDIAWIPRQNMFLTLLRVIANRLKSCTNINNHDVMCDVAMLKTHKKKKKTL